MKTGRRHELETNELADSLGHWVESARPYTNAILAAVLAVLVCIAIFMVARQRNAASAATAWEEYFAALSRQDRLRLEDLGEQYSGTPVGLWSLCMAADMGLGDGSDQLFRDKALANEILRKAANHYEEVLGKTREPALVKQAQYGLARTHECLGEIKQAEEEYQTIASKWPDTPFADAATARAKDLQRHETKIFYDWFERQDVRHRMTPQSGTPGFNVPFDMNSLPGSSSTSRPSDGAPADGSSDSGLPETSDSETNPPESGAAPADGQPGAAASEGAPSATPPSGGAPPAETTPSAGGK
jgi:hypothetical protein